MTRAPHVEHGRAADLVTAQLDELLDVTTRLTEHDLLAASLCHGWTVVDVLVHVHLGLQEMLAGTVATTDAPPDTDAASYWRADVPRTDATSDDLDALVFVRRTASAYRRPSGAVAHLGATADGLRRAVAAMRPGAVAFQGHVLTTGDFLATWVVELVVHQLDLRRELAVPVPSPEPLALAAATVTALGGAELPAPLDTVLAGTGRTPGSRGVLG